MKDIASADILDMTASRRSIWYQKDRPDVVYADIREATETLSDGNIFEVRPDVVADFRALPFPDDRFEMVVFDPPHSDHGTGDICKKYGRLGEGWREDIRAGFGEAFRVLRPCGFLVFKWSECDFKLSEVEPLFPAEPLFGTRTGRRGIWLVFRKDA